MLRLILIILLYMLIRSVFTWISRIIKVLYNKGEGSVNNQKNVIQDLAKCRYCGLYLPAEESFYYHGEIFCCKEHAHKFS